MEALLAEAVDGEEKVMSKKRLCISVTEQTDRRIRKYAATRHFTISQAVSSLVWQGELPRKEGILPVQRVFWLSRDTDERLQRWCWENLKTADEAINNWIWYGLKIRTPRSENK